MKPNFIFILIDDMGWTDLACFGSNYYETPNIDALAAEGMKFTHAYAACTVCSPTRASIMTGKYPARLHLTDWIPGHERKNAKLKIPEWTQYLPLEEVTIARALKSSGYTTASIGKWHLGSENYFPQHHGFDVNTAGCDLGAPPSYFYPYKRSRKGIPGEIPDLENGKEGEYLTDRLTDETLTFIENNKDNPFFLYFSHYAVHTPLMALKDMEEKYEIKIPEGEHSNPTYAAMIESVDNSVGRVRAKLQELGLAETTVIVFFSDNGGLVHKKRHVTSNVPLRAGKGSVYEGGVRVPLIVYWPGVTEPGSICDVPVISNDFYPTFLDIAGADGDSSHNTSIDGVSIAPLLRGERRIEREAIYWHYPHYHTGGATPYSAIREGDYKLIEFFEDNHVELYNLKEDIGETKDLADSMPEKATVLKGRLHKWRKEVNAQLPIPNPDYNPDADG